MGELVPGAPRLRVSRPLALNALSAVQNSGQVFNKTEKIDFKAVVICDLNRQSDRKNYS